MNDDRLHGGALDRMRQRFPNAPAPWIDLSTGINPHPYPHTRVDDDALRHLPTRAAHQACRAALAAAIDAPDESLLLAPGSELLIRLLPTVLEPERVAVLHPTYGDHGRAWRAHGCEVIESDDPLALAGQVDIVVLCQPNNPDGRQFDRNALLTACRSLADRGGWLIVDEAYADLDPACSIASAGGERGLIVLRSFGKFYGLAGVRLGALIAPATVLDAMEHRLGVWPVSGPALQIATRAYADLAWQRSTRSRLSSMRHRLDALLRKAGISRIAGTDLYRQIHVADADAFWLHCAERGIYLRRFAGSTHRIRLGLPVDQAGFERLDEALRIAPLHAATV